MKSNRGRSTTGEAQVPYYPGKPHIDAAKHLRLTVGRYINDRALLRDVEEAMEILRAAVGPPIPPIPPVPRSTPAPLAPPNAHPDPTCSYTPCTCPNKSLIGIVHFWVRSVMLVETANEFMPADTVGDMEVLEIGRDGRVINARFHPGGEGNGYGLVINPRWRHLDWQEIENRIEAGVLTETFTARRT